MGRVFVVQHEHELPDHDDVKLIGVYSTQEDAERAIARLRLRPGFCDSPDGFSIDSYDIGKDHWTEGLVTVRPSGREGDTHHDLPR